MKATCLIKFKIIMVALNKIILFLHNKQNQKAIASCCDVE